MVPLPSCIYETSQGHVERNNCQANVESQLHHLSWINGWWQRAAAKLSSLFDSVLVVAFGPLPSPCRCLQSSS
jgi:hypothetical protein